jgi:hypothetical protein
MLRRDAILTIDNDAQRLTQVFLRVQRLVSALSSSQRTVSAGSSASTVALLVRMAWLCAQALHIAPRLRRGDPLALPAGHRRAPIQRCAHF